MTPDLALQVAVGDTLAATPGVVEHVAPERIRSGSIRPENMPAIVLAPARVNILGRASGGQVVAEVSLMIHLWAVDDGSDVAQSVAASAMLALLDAPEVKDAWIDEWDRPALAWIPDPDPARSHSHAAISLRAIIRWRL